jgi:predicted nuclease of predicted toxin-antitoxin system
MRVRRRYRKQKPRLYFDENFPAEALDHFRTPYWRRKLYVTSAAEQGHSGKSDKFHYAYCKTHDYTLVTLDFDFNNDRLYPFTQGSIAGVIIVRGSSSEVVTIANTLVQLLQFLLNFPYPRRFLADTKFLVARDAVTMRGRHTRTRHIKTLRVTRGTTIWDVCQFFGY